MSGRTQNIFGWLLVAVVFGALAFLFVRYLLPDIIRQIQAL
jgi:Kef-type K+ transport system membrane component KefB